MTLTRRDLLRDAFLAGAGLAILGCRTTSSTSASGGWSYVPELLRRIELPRIPKRDFPVTSTIEAAIAEAHAAGGGRVVVPTGEHLTGPLRLQSRIELHLEKGAVVKFAQEPERYPLVLTRWEGVELMNYSPLIYAFECEDVAITGEGTLDGQADGQHWWNWKGWTSDRPPEKSDPNAPQIASRNRLFQMGQEGVPVADRVFGPGHFLRPSFIEPYRCK
ncbi:MAG: glycoside hydrolase family 28 protein, partial [Acidobacteria bacterium]|nr:glycoside hydrolase family 28 protein [Acidobacteriota bacterium]